LTRVNRLRYAAGHDPATRSIRPSDPVRSPPPRWKAGCLLVEAKALVQHATVPDAARWHRLSTAQDDMSLAGATNPPRAADLSIRQALARTRSERRSVIVRSSAPQIILRMHLDEQVACPRPTSPAVFNVTRSTFPGLGPQWDYLFLTKFPSRHITFLDAMPPTARAGTSVEAEVGAAC
jgi:hypothetical protein